MSSFVDSNRPCDTHIPVANAEMLYPPHNCAYIHHLVSVNIEQVLMNVNGGEGTFMSDAILPDCYLSAICIK